MGFRFTRPDAATIEEAKAHQQGLGLTYPASFRGLTASGDAEAVGAALGAGWAVDFNRVEVGRGAAAFEAACDALRRWEMFELGWVSLWTPETPLVVGEKVGILAAALGLWALNFAEIVYTLDEKKGEVRWFGFGYGTLPDHVECGEERFMVGWDQASDVVWYELLAFSKPQHLLAKLGTPYVRRRQRQFARDSKAAMAAAVHKRLQAPSNPPGVRRTS